MFQQIVKLSIY